MRTPSRCISDSPNRQSLPMKIKNHNDFPKLDHRTAPLVLGIAALGVIDSPPIPRARPGDGRHNQLRNFQPALLGENYSGINRSLS